MSAPFRSLRAGFTLIEVMLSTAIMVVIVLAVVTIASDSMRVYDRAVADLSTQSEARGLLDALDNDISTAVIRPDGRCWMEVVIPQGSGAPATPVINRSFLGNVHAVDQPILMLFSSPIDRPRWTSEPTGRRQLRGDVCAVAYRIGQRSPFDMPGEKIQQIYGVYRTVIDPENTFTDAFGVILGANPGTQVSPWNYWTGVPRNVHEYAPSVGLSGLRPKSLIDATQGCWTLDEQNFIASNVVAMNLVFWCTSSLPPAVTPSSPMADPVGRMSSALRPVFAVGADPELTARNGDTNVAGGYGAVFRSGTTAGLVSTAPIRYASVTPPAIVTLPAPNAVHPQDLFLGRLRIYSDRMYPDAMTPGGALTAAPLPYMPYTLRGIEVSVTILTPEGSKELRGLQHQFQESLLTGQRATDFRRIVYQHGRNYSRYIRILGNGG
jgi:prepilin-type N-terminal cleavage/methylation domain-containing protein